MGRENAINQGKSINRIDKLQFKSGSFRVRAVLDLAIYSFCANEKEENKFVDIEHRLTHKTSKTSVIIRS